MAASAWRTAASRSPSHSIAGSGSRNSVGFFGSLADHGVAEFLNVLDRGLVRLGLVRTLRELGVNLATVIEVLARGHHRRGRRRSNPTPRLRSR